MGIESTANESDTSRDRNLIFICSSNNNNNNVSCKLKVDHSLGHDIDSMDSITAICTEF